MISKSLLLIACIAFVRAQQPCLHAPQNPHSFAASPLSCAHYTICMGGHTIVGPEHHCEPGHLFDPPTQTCGQTSCMECSPFGIQNLPHPDDCYQYIECILGNRRVLTCPNGLMFDRTVGQCNQVHLVNCPGQPTDPPPYPTETYPTETYPTETYPTETFPTETWPTEPWPPVPTDPPGGFEPNCSIQIFHAHPTDCTRFFICVLNVPLLHECPSELHWNQLINACDFPEFARCLSGGGGTTTTTTTFPTTEPPLYPPIVDQWTTPKLLPPNPSK